MFSLVSIGFAETWLIVLVAFVYLLGVQGITVAIHIPLNNHIQRIKIEDLNDEAFEINAQNSKQNGISLIIFEQVSPFRLACYCLYF